MKTNDIVYPFYQSPTLPDTTHILTIAINATSSTQNPGLVNTIVDYVTVTAGESTSLVGERLIVDESDPSVIFEGNWTQDTDPALSGSNGSLRYAYANTTHQTSSNGASATIPFNGTTVSVFGVCYGSPIDLDISIDGEPRPSELLTFINSTNFQWFSMDGLAPTNHTLKLTLLNAGDNNATFNLDYIIYTPSFTSLAEKEGLSTQQHFTHSSQSQETNTANLPQNSTILSPSHPGISHGTLLGVVVGPIFFGVIIILIILILRRKKLLFWSSKEKPHTVIPFSPPHPQTQGLSQIRVYHKSSTVNGQNVQETPVSEHDLPSVDMITTSQELTATRRIAHWWIRLWQRTEPGTVEAFPTNYNPSIARQSMVQRKPTLPVWASHGAQRRTSHQSNPNSENETIVPVVDPQRLQELEELVLSLQQEIEQSRQAYGTQNGVLMREMVGNGSNTTIEHAQQGNEDRGSMTISATVV
ncbi:hypothetical protein J132_00121 [Termitomyces sp. J132]|nr:hypothetical protein H2248_001878 [Termitomyces sp. 'cryptogamus']KNZ82306.1 hypothetical protein J132_00121 [Termitomyces sp. J132]